MGVRGLGRDEVERDQRQRLRAAIVELVAQRGYHAVRVLDVTRLAHVSRPTFYRLYAGKDELLVSAYDEIAARVAGTVLGAYQANASKRECLRRAMRAFMELGAADPDAMSLLVVGAFGGGAKAGEHRRLTLARLEAGILQSRDGSAASEPGALLSTDFTIKVILGGIGGVTASRLCQGRASELPGLADELSAWAARYRPRVPAELEIPAPARWSGPGAVSDLTSERARRAEGRMPSGRHDLPREVVVKSQRERIVDATAAIVAQKGLAGLSIPEIASRANVSHETFYAMYPTKHAALLGAQKVGLHQALQVALEAYRAHPENWPRAVAAGLRALMDFVTSEPAHAHLSLVDTFAAIPEASEIRDNMLLAFAAYLDPGLGPAPAETRPPSIAAEATAAGLWLLLSHYLDKDRIADLPAALPQLTYFALTPFLGPQHAAAVALGEGNAGQLDDPVNR
ncbi:MAG: TetR/AcrR family transcriptional regulator, partial [Actinomycetota bacterium]|nr:TetR/AcrR family transcriptional regulator [Actinomycetota bacterium]